MLLVGRSPIVSYGMLMSCSGACAVKIKCVVVGAWKWAKEQELCQEQSPSTRLPESDRCVSSALRVKTAGERLGIELQKQGIQCVRTYVFI